MARRSASKKGQAATLKEAKARLRETRRELTGAMRRSDSLESELAQFKAIAEFCPDMVFINRAGRVTYANPKALRLMEYSLEEFTSADFDFMSIIAPESQAAVRRNYERHLQGEEVAPYEYTLVTRSGKRISGMHTTKLLRMHGETAILGIITDITEHKRVREEFRGIAQQQQFILDNIDEIVYELTDEPNMPMRGKVEFVSLRATSITGYSPDEFREDPALWFKSIHPDDLAGLAAATERITRSKSPGTREYRIRNRHSGEYRWIEDRVVPKVDAHGRVYGSFGVARDVTDRKQAEEVLRESEERYRQVVENAADIIFTVDIRGNFTYANPAALKDSGYTLDELLHMNYRDMVAPPYANRMLLHYARQASRREPTNYAEYPYRTKDGRIKWYGHTVTLIIKEGQFQGFHAIARDITERKEMEDRLRLSDEVLQRVNAIVLVSDTAGRIAYVSPSVRQLLGYEPDELMGEGWWNLTRDDAKAREDERERVIRSLQKAGPSLEEPYERMIKDRWGAEHWILWQNSLGPAHTLIGVGQDITDRKRGADQLYQSNQMLQFVLDAIPQRVFWKSSDFRYLGCNQSFARDAGLNDPSEIIGRDDFDLTWKKTAHLYRADDRLVMETNKPKLSFEEPQLTEEGTQRWLLTSKVPFHDQEGKVIGVLGTYEDTTEKRQTEESQRRLLQAVEHSDEVIFMTDKNGIITYANPAFQKVYGFSREEVLGRTPRIIKSGQLIQKVYEDFWNQILSGRSVRTEIVNRTKDGRLLTVQSSVNPVYGSDDSLLGFIAVQEDVTERKRSEERIRELATLLDIASDAIAVIDLDRKILYWNNGAERLYGWTAQEAVGRQAEDLLHPSSAEGPNVALQETLKTGRWNGELQQISKGAKELKIESRWTLMHDVRGRPHRILVVSTDITEKKLLEAQFYRTQRLESLGTLASGIAHDLNNVFTPILMATDMLKGQARDEQLKKYMATIETSSLRGQRIVQQVLSFARGMDGERVPLRPSQIIEEVQHIVSETFPRSIGLQCDVPHDLWNIVGDPTQVHQVLMNLCLNARDAMPNGGVLQITARNEILDADQIRGSVDAQPGPHLVLTVSDTGSGIPPGILDKIFDPFFTTKGPGKGTGLGLATVHTIVRKAGGFITVESAAGEGTTFRVYLPCGIGSPREEEKDVPAELLRGAGELILVVDDEDSVRDVSQETLEEFGYRVMVARDGTEAVALFAEHRQNVALVVTDLMMPHMDGHATIRALRRIDPNVRVVAMSGLPEREGGEGTLPENVLTFIAKPFRTDALLRAIYRSLPH